MFTKLLPCWLYPLLYLFDQVFALLEAGQVSLTEEHHLHDLDDLVSVLLDGHEAEAHEFPVLEELLGLVAAEDVDHVLGELEGRLL